MNTLSPSLTIGVIRGGTSPEYDVSLKSGAQVLKHLSETHRPIDIFISKDGRWHMQGIEKPAERILKHVDVVFNALHGGYGENGGVQDLLDQHGVPYTGSGKLSSAIGMNKVMTKKILLGHDVRMPIYSVAGVEDSIPDKAQEIFGTIPHPMVVKPVSGASSIGIYLVHSYANLVVALETVLSAYNSALVEEYIEGKEATCGVLEKFRGEETYALPPVEIVTPPHKTMFDYDSKYSGQSREVCPGNFSDLEKRKIEEMSRLAHTALGLRHYSRSDFIVHPRRGVYFLEVNTLPGLTEESLMPKSLTAVGANMPQFIEHVLALALHNK